MDKQPIVNINFTGITDYIRDKDLEIANLKSEKRYSESESSFYKSKYNGLNDRVQEVIKDLEITLELALKHNSRFTEDGNNLIQVDIDHIKYLLDILKGGDISDNK